MPTLLQSALEYAAQGWPIFPTKTDKTPYTNHGVLDATTNLKKIKEWWEKWPKANIGLDVGAIDMMVLDLDPGHDMKELEKNVGTLPKTLLSAETPRGGLHLYYAINPEEYVPQSASKVARSVDIRSFHSYVLLPPSKTSAGCYRWIGEGKAAFRTQALLDAATTSSFEKSDDSDNWIIEPDLEENIDQAIKWLRDESAPAIEGQGGDTMAYKTAAMMKSYGLSPETAFEVMWDYWNPKCIPPWSADEADHLEMKIRNGYSYNRSQPGNMTKAYRVAKAQQVFSPVSRDTKGKGTEVKAGRFRFVDYDGMQAIEPPKWLIKDTLPERGYGMLVGKRGTFKTFVALDMALSVASGASSYFEDDKPEHWQGIFPEVSKPGPVIIAVGEGRSSIKNRVEAWSSEHLEGDKIENILLADPVPRPHEEDINAFINGALEIHDEYSLVVLDTVGRSMQGLNENIQQDASKFTRMVESIQCKLNCAVLAIHHMGHNEDRARGSSVFGADIDCEFIIERKVKENFIRLKNTKQKDGPEWKQARLIELKLIPEAKSLVTRKLSPERHGEINKLFSKKLGGAKKSLDQAVIFDAAYQLLKDKPNENFSRSKLCKIIGEYEHINMTRENLTGRYFKSAPNPNEHPLGKCYCPSSNKYQYKE